MTSAAQVRRRQHARRVLRRAGMFAAIVAVAYGLSLAFGVGDRATDLRLFGIGVGAIVLAVLVDLVHRRTDARQGRLLDQLTRLDPDATRRRPKGLAAAENSVTLALRSAEGRDRWFRADIRLIVHDRCSVPDDLHHAPSRRGRVDVQADLVRVLDPSTWDLIRPDRPKATTRDPGVAVPVMTRILDDVERL